MHRLDINAFSKKYGVKELREKDIIEVFDFCSENTFYYECCGKNVEIENIRDDMTILPPGKEPKDKYYVGFYNGNELVAVMDLIDGYPVQDTAYIGFFMMNIKLQGTGNGTLIIEHLCGTLRYYGLSKITLAYVKDNPQSKHFWHKNGFEDIREVLQATDSVSGVVVVSSKELL